MLAPTFGGDDLLLRLTNIVDIVLDTPVRQGLLSPSQRTCNTDAEMWPAFATPT